MATGNVASPFEADALRVPLKAEVVNEAEKLAIVP